MKIYTTDTIEGEKIEKSLGLVQGAVVQSKHIGRDIMAGLKTIVGGEISGYTEMLQNARSIATERMIEEAKKIDADAIVGVRFGSSSLMAGSAEIIVYGTAVKLK